MQFNSNEDNRGVSPVIGVILMVAITVILAAVIGTFVLGIGGNVKQPAQAGVTVSPSGGDYDVTLTSLGPSTNGIKCTQGTGNTVDASTSTVGGTITCHTGNNVVAYGSSVSNSTVRTNLGS